MGDDTISGFVFVFVFGAVFCIGLLVGGHWGASGQRDQAVQAGVGRWTTDPKTGNTTFVYGVAP